MDNFQNEQLSEASIMAKKEIVHKIEGLFNVPKFLFLKLETDIQRNIVELIEQVRINQIHTKLPSLVVSQSDEVTNVKRAFDFVD